MSTRALLHILAAVVMATGPEVLPAQRPVVTPAGESGAGARSQDEAQVVATIRALFDAAERVDLRALDTLYAGDSLTIIEGAGIDRTWADYRDHHLVPEMREFRNLQYRPVEIEPHVAGNLAWAIFRYTLTADVNGRPANVIGRGTAILERRGVRWVVRHTHTSGRTRRATDSPGR